MSVVTFFLGFLAGATLAAVVATTWLGRCQTEHFARMLEQIRSLDPRA